MHFKTVAYLNTANLLAVITVLTCMYRLLYNPLQVYEPKRGTTKLK